MNAQIDFRKPHDEDATLQIQIWDWDSSGDDDFISLVTFNAEDIKKRCCTTDLTQKQGKVREAKSESRRDTPYRRWNEKNLRAAGHHRPLLTP